jgi:hypothetical protein
VGMEEEKMERAVMTETQTMEMGNNSFPYLYSILKHLFTQVS